jgi:hypothetical protein
MQSYGYIYLIIDHFTHKSYVGKSTKLSSHNIDNYLGSGKIISKIINKRIHHLEKRILGYCKTIKELNYAEKVCIEFYCSNNRVYGYNLTDGGDGGNGGANKGKYKSDEVREKIRQSLLGRKLPQNVKDKISKKSKEWWSTNTVNYKHTEEAKRKISEAGKGRIISEETKKKISESEKRTKSKKINI